MGDINLKKTPRMVTYVDYETESFEHGPYQESKKSKVSRVHRLYEQYKKLSRIEQYNFANLIQNTPQ